MRSQRRQRRASVSFISPSAGAGQHALLDHLIRLQQHRLRNRQSKRLPVFRLMISSNFVGCSMGNSAGFAPLRILSK